MHIAVLTKLLSYSGLANGGREVNSCDALQEEGEKKNPSTPMRMPQCKYVRSR